jgi:hypothetical protein
MAIDCRKLEQGISDLLRATAPGREYAACLEARGTLERHKGCGGQGE